MTDEMGPGRMGTEQMRERVLSYLYGMLSPAEEEAFRGDLAQDANLAQILAQEQSFQQQLPLGSEPALPDDALAQSRMRLRAALRQELIPGTRQTPMWRDRFSDFIHSLIPRLVWASGGVALVVCGIIVGRTVLLPAPPAAGVASQLVDVHVEDFDRSTGRVHLQLSSLVTSRLEGDLADTEIQLALATALRDGMGPGPRLQAVELLGLETSSASVRQVLSHALLHDQNPGVRVAAAEALSSLTHHDAVRQALYSALLEDENPGVRVAAIEGLRSLRDPDTRRVLERTSFAEFNDYIRNEASRTLQGWDPTTQL